MIATHLNAPYGPVVTEGDVAESLRRGVPSASTSEANAILEALFVECEASLIERAAAERSAANTSVSMRSGARCPGGRTSC